MSRLPTRASTTARISWQGMAHGKVVGEYTVRFAKTDGATERAICVFSKLPNNRLDGHLIRRSVTEETNPLTS